MGNLCSSDKYVYIGLQKRLDIHKCRCGNVRHMIYKNHSYYVFFRNQDTNKVVSVNIVFQGKQKMLTMNMELIDDQFKIESIVVRDALFVLKHPVFVHLGYIGSAIKGEETHFCKPILYPSLEQFQQVQDTWSKPIGNY
jgi:hypothetical protein